MKKYFILLPALALAFITFTGCNEGSPKPEAEDNLQTHSVSLNTSLTDGGELSEEPALTSLVFDNLSHNFGEQPHSADFTHKFVLKNTGSADLLIENVKPSCSCTTPDWTKEAIKPGESGFITAKFNPKKDYVGAFSKSVTVKTNTDPALTVLKISGEIVN